MSLFSIFSKDFTLSGFEPSTPLFEKLHLTKKNQFFNSQNQWSPTYDVAAILTSIQSLLDEPNPNSPANSQAAQLYRENRREYEKRVHAIVEQV